MTARRYVSVKRAAAGVTTVTVTLVDGDLSAGWSVKSYLHSVEESVVEADQAARKALTNAMRAVHKIDDLEAAS